MGSMATLLLMLRIVPSPNTSLPEYAVIRGAMGAIATWILLPALAITLVAGLLAIAFNVGYQNAGWAWVKLATGILIFEGGFTNVVGPMQQEASRSAAVLAGQVDPTALAGSLWSEQAGLWLLLVVATANVVLGVWRPRFSRSGKPSPELR